MQRDTMALTTDQALDKVGSFGRFQLLLLLFGNALVWVWSGWPLLVMTFTAAEPPWKCVTNSSVCTFPGKIIPGDDDYEKRCSMPRGDWEFSDDFTSVVTEVRGNCACVRVRVCVCVFPLIPSPSIPSS